MAIKPIRNMPYSKTKMSYLYADPNTDQTEASTVRELAWDSKNWIMGEPIDYEKLDNMDNALVILMTQVQALLKAFGGSIEEVAPSGEETEATENTIQGGRIDTIEQTLGVGTTGPDTLLVRVDNLESDDEDHESRLETIEHNLGYDNAAKPDKLMNDRVTHLEECCENVRDILGTDEKPNGTSVADTLEAHGTDIDRLIKYIIEHGSTMLVNYLLPFTMESAIIDMPSLIVEDYADNPKFYVYDKVVMSCLGKNIWDNTHFINQGITYDEETGVYKGLASKFKAAFNEFFAAQPTWENGVKISFDFNFNDPLKSLRLVYDYGDIELTDTRAYQQSEEGFKRLSFLSIEENGTQYPVYGIDKFFYGSEDNDAIVELKEVQVEIAPWTKYTLPQNPFSEEWEIPLPEPIYCGYIDLANRKIFITWGHIDSYSGQDVGANWRSATGKLETGVEVIYKLDIPRTYNIEVSTGVVTQGFNVVPTRFEEGFYKE